MRISGSNNVNFGKVWILRRNMSRQSVENAKKIKDELVLNQTVKSLDKKDIDVFIFVREFSFNQDIYIAFANLKTPRRVYIPKSEESQNINFKDFDNEINKVLTSAQKIDNGKCSVKKRKSAVLDLLNEIFSPRKRK